MPFFFLAVICEQPISPVAVQGPDPDQVSTLHNEELRLISEEL